MTVDPDALTSPATRADLEGEPTAVHEPETTGSGFRSQPFAAFIVGMLTDVRPGDGIRTYLTGIDATLASYGGRFLIHGGDPETLEGSEPGFDLIVIGFPTRSAADDWYASDAYRRLIPIRRAFATGRVTRYTGEPDDHHAADILDRLPSDIERTRHRRSVPAQPPALPSEPRHSRPGTSC